MGKFTTKSTSAHTQEVLQPIILDQKDYTRRIFIAIINDRKIDSGETLSGTIIHQRKIKKDNWEDVKSINLTKLKGGDGVKIRLNSTQTKKLYDGISELYALSKKGVTYGQNSYIVGKSNEILEVPEDRRIFIKQLINKKLGEEVWNELIESKPELATKLSWARIQKKREEVLQEFQQNLNKDKNEPYWQEFFKNNQWIFGYGLHYKFLTIETDQPTYGGVNYQGKGLQKGDFLAVTESEIKFTILIEIKKSTTPLFARGSQTGEHKRYRNGAWQLSKELVGGLSQLQINCNTWEKNADVQINRNLNERNIYTINPRSILIIGNTKEFNNDREKIETFETFRRNLSGIDIITYDELYERAKFIVSKAEYKKNKDLQYDESDPF